MPTGLRRHDHQGETAMCRHSDRSYYARFGGLVGVLVAASLLGAAWPQAARADEAAALEEVTVTAQRRTERLQDVPVAVTAISATELFDRGVRQAGDMPAAGACEPVSGRIEGTEPRLSRAPKRLSRMLPRKLVSRAGVSPPCSRSRMRAFARLSASSCTSTVCTSG